MRSGIPFALVPRNPSTAVRFPWLASLGDRPAAGLVALAGVVLALAFLVDISMLDEGTIVHIADRLASGEVLYRDVATGVMPGTYYLHALLFLLFGRSLLVGRLFMIGLFALASASVFLVARDASSRPVALAASAAFMGLSVHYWSFPGYSPQAIFLLLLTLAAARAFIGTRRPLWLALTGLGIGLTILFKQNYGAFLSLGVATGLAAAAPDLRRGVRDVATAALVAASPIAIVAGLFARAGAGSAFWSFTVGVPLQGSQTVFARPWPPLLGEPEPRILRDIVYYLPFEELALDAWRWLASYPGLALAVVRLAYHLPPLFLLAAGAIWARRRARFRRSPDPGPAAAARLATGALYLGTSCFLFLGVFPRVDAHHLFMALAPCFLLGAWLLGPSPPRLVRRSAVGLGGFLLAVSALSQVAAVYAVHPEEIRDAYLDHPRAGIWVERWQAAQIRAHLAELESRVPEGEPIFVAPSSPMYYFLADRPNPTRYPLILPGALDEEEAVRELRTAPVRYALVSDIAFEHFPIQHVAPTVWDYLDRHFVPAEGAGWDVAPFAPYLYAKREGIETASNLRAAGSLVEPPLSQPPAFQVVSHEPFRDDDPYRVEWQSTYLEPSLVVRATGGWRKVLVSWEVPVEPGLRLELAGALTPWAWAGWVEGQGALVEAWVSSSPPTGPPRRAFLQWINPRDVPEERRWHEWSLDLAALVETPEAIVTLVVGPAPTFVEGDAVVAFKDLRLVVDGSEGGPDPRRLQARNVRLDRGAARPMLAFREEDLSIFREAARRYPDLDQAHIALAEVAASLNLHDLAISAAEEAVRLEPDVAYYRMRLGQELQSAGRLAEAMASMEAALDLEPRNANYRAALGAARLQAPSKVEGAKADALEALRLDSSNAWAWTVLATAEERTGNVAAALEAAERSVELAPGVAWPKLVLARSLLALERRDEAMSALEKAALLSMDAGARAELARLFLEGGLARRARDEALAAVEMDPTSLGALVVLGHAETASGLWEPAARTWREAARLDPESSSVRVQLARALAMTGRTEEAHEAVAAARDLAGEDPARLREVAIVLDELGSSSEATAVWRRVLLRAHEGELKDEARRRLAEAARALNR